MGITIRSFIDWPGFQPGPGFALPVNGGIPNFDLSWQYNVPDGTKARLVAAVPSVLSTPSIYEWKADISAVEWKAVGTQWIDVAQTIIRTDPDFTYYRQAWFVTTDGHWTEKFKAHDLWKKFADLLMLKMERVFAYNRGLIQGVSQSAGQNIEVVEQPFDLGGQDENANLGIGGWVVRSFLWASRNPVARCFIPGPGQLIAPAVAIGLYIYSRHHSLTWSLEEVDEPKGLAFTAASLTAVALPPGFNTERDLGLLAVEHPTDPLFKFSGVTNGPLGLRMEGDSFYG